MHQGSIAYNYDQFLGPLFFEPYAIHLISKWKNVRAKHVLELACGTGRLTRYLLQLIDQDGLLSATDLDKDMLAIAKSQLQDPRLIWQQADAQELPYEDQNFDLVVCQFGVMFFRDKLEAFKEAYRVLKPGGIFLFLTWDNVVYNAVSAETQAVLQAVFPNDPPSFSKKGPYSYFDKTVITTTMHEAGFHGIDIAPIALTGKAKQVDEVVWGVLDGSPLSSFVEERGGNIEIVKEQLKQALSNYAYVKENEFHYPMQALHCTGLR